MPRTIVRQDAQVQPSRVYTDNVASGSTMESSPTNVEDDLNNLRSQINRIIKADVTGNWFDDVPTVNSKKRGLSLLNTDLDDLETHKFLCRANVLTDITVTASQNWEILSVAGSEAPTQVQAQVATTNGAVVALSAFSGAGFSVHELVEVAGPDALHPKNLCVVRDASTGQVIQSSGRDVFALLQVESTGTDGVAFDDVSASNRVKLSFVRPNATFDDLEACPVVDIENKSINYAYVFREELDNLPESCMISSANFIDQVASVDVTLDNAIDNQAGPATQTDRNIDWRITDDFTLKFQDSTGARDLLAILPTAASDTVQMNVDDLDINNVNDADFLGGAKFDTGGTPILVGSTVGHVETTGTDNLHIQAGGELFFDDLNQTGSTWAQTDGIKLSETTQEWTDFETNFGEVSLLNAIIQAKNATGGAGSTRLSKTVAIVTSSTIAANTNVTGAGGTPNIDAQLGDYSAVGINFVTDVDIYVNGILQRNGADAAANHDVYPGDTPANGDLKFEYILVGSPGNPDVITMIIYE